MTTTELIKILKSIEFGASGRSRKINIKIDEKYISEPNFKIIGTGDGVAGTDVCLKISKEN